MTKKSRGWCFTINNWTEDDVAYLMNLYEETTNMVYMVVGFEKGTRLKTPHIQGYCYFTNPISINSSREIFYPNHVEPQKSKTNVAAYCYCMTDRDYYEMGERPRQGHRTDLEVIKHDILSDRPMKDIANHYFSQWCQYRRAFDEYKKMNTKYDTKIYIYDADEVEQYKKMYELYDAQVDYMSDGFELSRQILHKYFSKMYRFIFVTATQSELLSNLNIETLG